jgi:site-specific DNA recombinase
MRAVIYARYSSDLQRDASIEDQVEVCGVMPKRRAGRLSGLTKTRRSAAPAGSGPASRS